MEQTQLMSCPQAEPASLEPGDKFVRGEVSIHFDRAERCYGDWPEPTCIVVDGPYGVDGYPGDMRTAKPLAEWYEPHIRAWSDRATPQTTLWFWNTELGWANVHPILEQSGWEYRCCNLWDKGLSHIAGNANTRTLRKYASFEFRVGGRLSLG